MKNNENNDSIKNKLAIFDSGIRKSAKIDLTKKDNSISKLLEKFQPQKSNEINNKKINLNDLKKNEKKENKDNSNTEIQKIKESITKINASNNINNTIKDNSKPKNQETFESIKKNDKKILPPQKKEDIPRTNTSFNNSSVLEMIKKLNQNEEKNKIIQTSNKGPNKPFETSNKYNNNKINENKNKNIISNEKKVNEDKSKNIHNNEKKINETQNKSIHNNSNNNYFKNNENEIVNRSKSIYLNKNTIKEMQTQKNNSPQRNKFLDNIQKFSQNVKDKAKPLNQDKNMKNEYLTMNSTPINSDNKNASSSNFKDKLKSIENNLKKNDNNSNSIQRPKETIKIINQEKEEKAKILSSLKRNSIGIDQKAEQKGISDLITKFTNKPKKNNNIEEDKREKGNNEEIIKAQIPKSTPQAQFVKENTPKNKETNNLSKDMDINENDNNSKNLEFKSETPILDSINNDKRSKSTVKIITQNSENRNDIKCEVLEQKPINSELQTNSFCVAFFITSFPKKDPKIIENSEMLKSDCTHKDCSLLPGLKRTQYLL